MSTILLNPHGNVILVLKFITRIRLSVSFKMSQDLFIYAATFLELTHP